MVPWFEWLRRALRWRIHNRERSPAAAAEAQAEAQHGWTTLDRADETPE